MIIHQTCSARIRCECEFCNFCYPWHFGHKEMARDQNLMGSQLCLCARNGCFTWRRTKNFCQLVASSTWPAKCPLLNRRWTNYAMRACCSFFPWVLGKHCYSTRQVLSVETPKLLFQRLRFADGPHLNLPMNSARSIPWYYISHTWASMTRHSVRQPTRFNSPQSWLATSNFKGTLLVGTLCVSHASPSVRIWLCFLSQYVSVRARLLPICGILRDK